MERGERMMEEGITFEFILENCDTIGDLIKLMEVNK